MKKTTKKLNLNRETVRELDLDTLNQAQGGAAAMSSGCGSSSLTLPSSC